MILLGGILREKSDKNMLEIVKSFRVFEMRDDDKENLAV